jgi:hypothetical protein
MTEADYEKALKLIAAVEIDLRRFLSNPAEYRAEYLEDTHCCISQVMELLQIPEIQEPTEET